MVVLGLELFSRISGVPSVGYANGQVETTNYQLLKQTMQETVQVIYDIRAVSLQRDFALLFPCY